MRVLIFHGYLLRGTGSNIYNLSLARALAALGHEVHLVCQERHPEALDLPEAVTVHNPDIGRILPVYVADEYEGFDAVPFSELSDAELEHYLDANVEAVREVARGAPARRRAGQPPGDGPGDPARALGGSVPYAVKVHGSALEYTVRPQPERFLPYAREGLGGAAACWWARATPPRASGRWWATGPAGAHPPGPARGGRARVPPAAAWRGRRRPGSPGRAPRGRRGGGLGRRGGRRGGARARSTRPATGS